MSKLTLVLLPGMDGTGLLFEPLISALGDGYEIVVVRYPAEQASGYSELEELARQTLPAQGKFILLGESFSGPIAVSLAASRPAGLVGLVLCSTFVRSPLPGLALFSWLPVKSAPAFLRHFFLLGATAPAALKAVLDTAIGNVSGAVLRARVQAVGRVDVRTLLRHVQVPVLYLQAHNDRVVPSRAGREVTVLLPATQLVSVPGPHCLLQVAPVETASIIKKWLVKQAMTTAKERQR